MQDQISKFNGEKDKLQTDLQAYSELAVSLQIQLEHSKNENSNFQSQIRLKDNLIEIKEKSIVEKDKKFIELQESMAKMISE